MKVTVAYATPQEQVEISLEVSPHCSVALAIRQSGILQRFPEINFQKISVGIFSRSTTLETVLQAGDRVEIYRPLKIDPKQARLKRAKISNIN